GHIVCTRDAAGETSYTAFDFQNNLIFAGPRCASPAGLSIFDYDGRGNPVYARDPLGAELTSTYEPAFNRPVDWKDANGSHTSHTYDGAGNATSTAYADGSSEQYEYDAQGSVVRSVDRRGQESTYTHDVRGLLTSTRRGDGSRVDYTYDERGNVLTAAD